MLWQVCAFVQARLSFYFLTMQIMQHVPKSHVLVHDKFINFLLIRILLRCSYFSNKVLTLFESMMINSGTSYLNTNI